MEQIILKGELLLTLESKEDWVRKVPDRLPHGYKYMSLLWIDINGNTLRTGADFIAAEEMQSYPVRVYALPMVHQVQSIKNGWPQPQNSKK